MNNRPGIRTRLALELHRSLREDLVRRHPLRTLFWECTLRCNLSCRHCGSDCRAASGVRDMPLEEFLKVIDGIMPHVEPGKVMVIFSGGEPLLRPDLEKAGLELYRRGFPWGLVTNGMLLDERRLERLLRSGLHSVTVSLDGPEEYHNSMRGHPESYRRAMRAVRNIVRAPEIAYDAVTCVTPGNLDMLPQVRELLAGEGVKNWRLFSVFPAGRGADPALALDGQQFGRMLDFIRATRTEGRIKASYGCEGFLGRYEGRVRDNFFGCSAGVTTAGIRADGSISGCTSIRARLDQGNIRTDDFMDVWNNRFTAYRDRRWAKEGECAECRMFRYCGGNGMHLRDDEGRLTVCHYRKLSESRKDRNGFT